MVAIEFAKRAHNFFISGFSAHDKQTSPKLYGQQCKVNE